MLKINRKTKIFFVSAVVTIIAFISIESVMLITNSIPYSKAVEFIKSDSVIRKQFGAIHDLGIPTGRLNSPKGHSYFKIKIEGELKTEKIGIKLEEGPYDVWRVVAWEIL
jgi:hypothetical protein